MSNNREVPPNPYDYINPVADPKLFAGRDDELGIIDEELARLTAVQPAAPIVALVGARRVGKTSLLRRVAEHCVTHGILPVTVSLTDTTGSQPREFWREVLDGILRAASKEGIINYAGSEQELGFLRQPDSTKGRARTYTEQLKFAPIYMAGLPIPPIQVIQDDLEVLTTCAVDSGLRGVLVMIDESHLLVTSREITQQIRAATREVARCGILFAGERPLAQMFNDESQPLFAQARMISLGNFQATNDIAEAALLPLTEEQRPLMSPLTIEYLARLSQGKPNQIRLICSGIYGRYQSEQQNDLDMTIEVLDDVLDSIQSAYGSDYDIRGQVDAIRALNSVDLEILYSMTRYPDWTIEDVVRLDESFRGESPGELAVSRRRRMIDERRSRFIGLGLLRDDPGRLALAGDEFLYLYLRFWYEVNKYGHLRKSMILGKGAPTPFGEKVEKLVRYITWEVKSSPDIILYYYFRRDDEAGNVIAAVRKRYEILEQVLSGRKPPTAQDIEVVNECFRISRLVKESGQYHLVALWGRSLENPRESVRVELYFKEEILVVPIAAIKRQSEQGRVWLEEIDYWSVRLPDLDTLLEAVRGPSLDELLQRLPLVQRWFIESVAHRGHAETEGEKDRQAEDTEEDTVGHEWGDLYQNGDVPGAIDCINERLRSSPPRWTSARLHNDRGYIRYPKDGSGAVQDFERALDLHFESLQLTLLNLAVTAIDQSNWSEAIRLIDDALFLTTDRAYVGASFLRLRVPATHLPIAAQERWEQHPANVIEAGYINLVFSLLKSAGHQAAMDDLQEALQIMPSSIWMRYTLARLHLASKRADLAAPIYEELGKMNMPDPRLAQEVRLFCEQSRRAAGRPRKGRRR